MSKHRQMSSFRHRFSSFRHFSDREPITGLMRTESAQHQIVMLFIALEFWRNKAGTKAALGIPLRMFEWAEEFPYCGIARCARPNRFCLISVPCRLMTPFIDSQALNPRFKRGSGYS